MTPVERFRGTAYNMPADDAPSTDFKTYFKDLEKSILKPILEATKTSLEDDFPTDADKFDHQLPIMLAQLGSVLEGKGKEFEGVAKKAVKYAQLTGRLVEIANRREEGREELGGWVWSRKRAVFTYMDVGQRRRMAKKGEQGEGAQEEGEGEEGEEEQVGGSGGG